MGRVALAIAFVVAASVAAVALAGCGGGGDSGTNPSDPHVALGAHDFAQFACNLPRRRGRGGVSPAVPALTAVAKALTAAELQVDHRPRAWRVGEPDASPTCRSGAP